MHLHKNKFLVVALLLAFVTMSVAATKGRIGNHRNLKVLPQDITDQQLDSIMQTYNVALGVTCRFCHVPVKGLPDSLDYAVDKEPMKEEARKMMRMTIELNKKWFYYDSTQRPEYLKVVRCNTCHRGEAFPEF